MIGHAPGSLGKTLASSVFLLSANDDDDDDGRLNKRKVKKVVMISKPVVATSGRYISMVLT